MRSSTRLLSRVRVGPQIINARRPVSRCTPAPSLVVIPLVTTQRLLPSQTLKAAPFSSSSPAYKGLQPDSENPKPPATQSHTPPAGDAADITTEEYHQIADEYIDHLVEQLQEIAEDVTKGLEVEYSSSVLNISHPSGTYIINKQPPNKQIWLSSPVSGPKRYDWVVAHDGQHQKEGTETEDHDHETGGKWTYLRDGSTLSELLEKEIGVDLGVEVGRGDSDGLVAGREGRAGGGVSE